MTGFFDPILPVEWLAREFAMFAAVGFLLGGIDDIAVDLIWMGRSIWRQFAIFTRYPRANAATLPPPLAPGRLAVFVAAWQESAVIGGMISTALANFHHPDWRLLCRLLPQ